MKILANSKKCKYTNPILVNLLQLKEGNGIIYHLIKK